MKRSEFTGLGKVYRFTLTQQLKNKANLVSLVILLVLCLASVPASTLMGGGFHPGLDTDSSSPRTILVVNQTPLPIAPDAMNAQMADAQLETLAPDVAQVVYTSDENGYHVAVSGGEEVTGASQSAVIAMAQSWLQNAQLSALGIAPEQAAALSAGVEVDTRTVSGYLEEERAGFELRFGITYAYAIMVMILCTYAATYIVRIVVEEKASRLVELLMVSVQPLALILGKILAMMTYIFGMFLSMAVCIGLSYLGTSLFGDVSAIGGLLAMLNLGNLRLDAWTVIIVLVSLLLAYGGFSLLAGLAGTCCSRTEEIEGATGSVMFTVLAGYMVSCFTGAIPSQGVSIFTAMCPVVNVFCAPVQYTLGNIGLGWLIASWVEQALIVAALAVLTARVYRQLILSRGAKIKLRQLLAMAKKEAA